MPQPTPPYDRDNVGQYLLHVFGMLSGLLTSSMIYLGLHLGLFRAMDSAGSLTSAELAEKTGLHERWVREWLRQQAAAYIITYDGNDRFSLAPVAALVLVNDMSPVYSAGAFSALPPQFALLDKLMDSFRTGLGMPYDAQGAEGARGVEEMLAPWFRTMLVPLALPQLDGVVAKLTTGAQVADVGCGAGVALIEMAKAFPRSQFHGYDISVHALARAGANKLQADLSNVSFHNGATDPLPNTATFDFVTSFDCVHDMTNPTAVMRAVRKAIKDDGTWLIADVNAKPTFEENLARNPMVALMYGFSVVSCMSSGLSEPGGAGLGTLGLSEPLARQMVAEAGFTRFTRHDFGNPVDAYYEVRP